MGTQTNIIRDSAGRFDEKPQSPPEASLHPDAELVRMQARHIRHSELMAEGAYATPYDNVFIMDFEDEHPAADLTDIAIAIQQTTWDDDDYEGNSLTDEKRLAVKELSRRLAAGQGGVLHDAASVRPGDHIDMSRLYIDASPERAAAAAAGVAEVTRNEGASSGDVLITTDQGVFAVPDGTLIPVVLPWTPKTPQVDIQDPEEELDLNW